MPISVNLNAAMAKKNINLSELSRRINIDEIKLSKLVAGEGLAIRFSTLYKLCTVLDCKPNDILEPVDEETFQKLYGKKSPVDV